MGAPATLGELRTAVEALSYLPDHTRVRYAGRDGSEVYVAEMGVTVTRDIVDGLVAAGDASVS